MGVGMVTNVATQGCLELRPLDPPVGPTVDDLATGAGIRDPYSTRSCRAWTPEVAMERGPQRRIVRALAAATLLAVAAAVKPSHQTSRRPSPKRSSIPSPRTSALVLRSTSRSRRAGRVICRRLRLSYDL